MPSQTFSATGWHEFNVPKDVERITVTITGGASRTRAGGRVVGDLIVNDTQTLQCYVGGRGDSGSGSIGGAGGNGGGGRGGDGHQGFAGGDGGGGPSYIRMNTHSGSLRVVAGGGGGDSGDNGDGGRGGGNSAEQGGPGNSGDAPIGNATGGTQNQGGNGGFSSAGGGYNGINATNGILDSGARGGSNTGRSHGGGGGGGGYRAGGSGCASAVGFAPGGGGGGGSNYVGGMTNVKTNTVGGGGLVNGDITLTWVTPPNANQPPTPPTNVELNGNTVSDEMRTKITGSPTVSAEVNDPDTGDTVRIFVKWSTSENFADAKGPRYSDNTKPYTDRGKRTNVDLPDLAPNTRYWVRVYAEDNHGLNSTNYSAFSFWTDQTSPPDSLTVNGGGSGLTIQSIDSATFAWRFNDPNTSDLQLGFHIKYRVVATATTPPGAWTDIRYDNRADNASPSAGPPSSSRNQWVFDPGTFRGNTYYEWQVRTRDQQGEWSEWSIQTFRFFSASIASPPSLISPVGAIAVDITDPVTFTWRFNDPDPSDTQQKADIRWQVVGQEAPGGITPPIEPAYPSAILADNPRGYWRLGDSFGSTIMVDESGNARNGTYTGGVNVVPGSTGLVTDDPDTAVTLSTYPAFGQVAFGSWMNTGVISMEALIRPTAVTGNPVILDRDNFPAVRSWIWRLDANRLQLVFWTTGGGPFLVNGATALTPGTRYHVAATYDGTTARLYLNGVQDGSLAQSGTLQNTGVSPLTIGVNWENGGSVGSTQYTGVVDEVSYYGTALSAAKIAAHSDAANGLTPGPGPDPGDDPSWTTIHGSLSEPGANKTWTFPGGTFAVGYEYRWEVRTYDHLGNMSDWSSPARFWAIGTPGSEAGPDPIPELSTPQGTLGCGEYRVFIYQQGGQRILGEIHSIAAMQFQRVRDDISVCGVTTNGLGDSDCCDFYSSIRSWMHEIVVFRDGVRVWEGPITRITYTTTDVEFEARDVMVYVYRRVMRQGYNDTYRITERNPDGSVKASAGKYPVIQRAQRIITNALAPYDPNVLPYLTSITAVGDALETNFRYDYSTTAWEEVDALAATGGLDYTVIGRRILLWDTHTPIGRLPTMTDGDFSDSPIVSEYGMQTATYMAVTNGNGVVGAVSIDNPDRPAGTASYYPYGPIEMLASAYSAADSAPTEAVTQDGLTKMVEALEDQASRNIANRFPTPLIVRIPDNSSLSPECAVGFQQLIPGVWIPLRASGTCRVVTQWQKLDSVTVSVDDAGERVQVVMSPAPKGGIDPDADAASEEDT